MKFHTVFILIIAYCSGCFCKHLIKGYFRNVSAIYHTVVKVEFHGVSCLRKYKTVAFHDYRNRVIGGIIAYDNMQSKAIVRIIEGGIGYDHVHLRLKSQRGWGLDYDIAIYGSFVEIVPTTSTTVAPVSTTTTAPVSTTKEPVSVAIARVILRSQYIKDLEKEHLI